MVQVEELYNTTDGKGKRTENEMNVRDEMKTRDRGSKKQYILHTHERLCYHSCIVTCTVRLTRAVHGEEGILKRTG